jgi:DNA adenine methylase
MPDLVEADLSWGGNQDTTPIRVSPFLRWAGSKRKQIGRLASFWTREHRRYIEPFAGSASLFFYLGPEQAILGDNNDQLIEVFRVVRNNSDRLFARLMRIRRDPESYYRWRAKDPVPLDAETRALRFLYLNRNCFNGLYRTNAKGAFNVPIGRPPFAYFSKFQLRACADLISRAQLVTGDFEITLANVCKGDFVYLDPPFALRTRRVFRHYGTDSFDTTDIPRFAKALTMIAKTKADFLVSYADCPAARDLARQWNSMRFPILRQIASCANRRRQAYEWLITNMPLPADLAKAR